MALLEVNFLSKTLFRTVTMNVILPVDKFTMQGEDTREEKPFKTLYLLHGILGSHTDWISGSRIQRWAEEKNLAVVMPAGENAFYVDQMETGNLYGEFIGEELVEITRKMFPLSKKREDTFIGGLSMGGFGAMRNGLKYNDTFSHIISLSGALHILEDKKLTGVENIGIEEKYFGNIEEAVKSDKNPRVLIEALHQKKKRDDTVVLPDIFMACGTEDQLLKVNRMYHEELCRKGFDVAYTEAPGKHDWDFWDTYIKKALEWLPLESETQGINSGNVIIEK